MISCANANDGSEVNIASHKLEMWTVVHTFILSKWSMFYCVCTDLLRTYCETWRAVTAVRCLLSCHC